MKRLLTLLSALVLTAAFLISVGVPAIAEAAESQKGKQTLLHYHDTINRQKKSIQIHRRTKKEFRFSMVYVKKLLLLPKTLPLQSG